jgi:peptidoglycan/xylan/chitin deacetylase (PgdA/CDA1 family)
MDHLWNGNADAAITISFDDGYSATWQSAGSALLERGMSGTFHICSNLVGVPLVGLHTANWDQWQEAVNQGHEIGSHGFNHASLAGRLADLKRLVRNWQAALDRRAYTRQIWAVLRALNRWEQSTRSISAPTRSGNTVDNLRSSRQQIDQALGVSYTESFAYPGGRHSAAARRLVAEAGFASARSLDLGVNNTTFDPFALRAVSLTPGMSTSDLVGWIDQAYKTHAWLILVFHLVADQNDTGYPYFCSTDNFQRLLDTIQSRPVWVATQRQVMHHLKELDGYEPGSNR